MPVVKRGDFCWGTVLCFLLRVVRTNSEEESGVWMSEDERSMAQELLRSLQMESESGESESSGIGIDRDGQHDERMRRLVLRFSVAFVQKDISGK